MNEEEEKAIKTIEEFRDYYAREDIHKEDFNNNQSYEKALSEIRQLRNNFDKVLNLIIKLQKENEKLKNQEATQRKINELLVQRYSNSISLQKVKDKIRKNEEIIDISNDGDLIHELLQKNKVYEELLESEE